MASRTVAMALAVAAGLATAGMALAQDLASTPGGKAVLVRQAHYKDLGKAFGALGAELRKEAPDKAAISSEAATVKTLADDLPTWFPKGSGPEAGVKTAARPQIWTDAAGFAGAVAKLQAETGKLQEAALAGDLDAIKAQVRATGGACKACHDQYRAPEQH